MELEVELMELEVVTPAVAGVRRGASGHLPRCAQRSIACLHLVLAFLGDKSWISNGSARCGTKLA